MQAFFKREIGHSHNPVSSEKNKNRKNPLRRCYTEEVRSWESPPLHFFFILFHPPPSPKKCGLENKYLLTFSRSTSPKNPPTLRRKNPQTPRKKFLSNVKFSTSEVKSPFLGQKKRRKPACLGLSPLASTKIIHFPPKSKSR